MNQPIANTDTEAEKRLKIIFRYISEYVEAAFITAEVFATKVVVATLSLPIFLLAAYGGAIDGLVQRDLRKFGGGNESSFLYHNVKRAIKPIIYIAFVIYLAMPVTVHPNYLFVPSALLLGLLVWLTTSSFKKYV